MAYIEPDFKKYATRTYSRFGEDGLIKYLADTVELTNKFTDKPPYLVEIGVHANEGNTLALIQKQEWNGVWIDLFPDRQKAKDDGLKRFEINKYWVRKDNINPLMAHYDVPWDFDLFSLDIDGNDYWIWEALIYQPRIVVIEYNPHFLADESKVIKYWDSFNWRGDRYYGASLKALYKLGLKKGYTLVASYCHNAFFVRDDCIDNPEDFVYEEVFEYFPIHQFKTEHSIAPENQIWIDV